MAIIDRQLPFEYTIASISTDVMVPLPAAPAADFEAQVLAQWNAVYDAYNEVACIILGSMTPELHRQFENSSPYDMIRELKSLFEKQAGVERLDMIQTFHACKQEECKLYWSNHGLTSDFVGFVRNYNMHNMGKTIGELHALLIEYEKGLPKKTTTPQVMAIQGGRIDKANKKSLNAKGKVKEKARERIKVISLSLKTLNLLLKRSRQRMMPATSAKRSGDVRRIVKRDTLGTNLTRSVKCIFIGYPKETMGYYFYFLPENKIVVARYAEFLEKNLISQEVSGRAEKLEEIQDKDTSPSSENTSKIPMGLKVSNHLKRKLFSFVAVGSIMYAVRCTRPDVAFAQNLTNLFQQNPREPHWTTVKTILKYLRNTKDMFLVYGGNPEAELRVDCYCDAGFETDRDDTKISDRIQAEYIAASEAAMEAVWIRKFILGLGIVPKINEPIKMFYDNSAALLIANKPEVRKRSFQSDNCVGSLTESLVKPTKEGGYASGWTIFSACLNGSFRQNALSSASKTFFERVNIDGPNFNDGIGLKNCLEKTPAVEDLRSGSTFYKVANGQGKSVSEHVLEMKGLMDQLHTLGKPYDNDMAVNLINRSLNKDFGDFGLKDKVTPTPQVFSIQKGRDNKSKPQGNKQKKGKGKADKNKQVVPSQPKPNPKKRKEKPY
ncbi:hypothetical protein Tco_1475692 [Tanacetum coccineum]